MLLLNELDNFEIQSVQLRIIPKYGVPKNATFFSDYFCKFTNCALGPPKYLGQIPTNSEKF